MSAAVDVETWSFPPQPGDLEPFELGSGGLGALLIHGFCGTPPEMRGLGEHLAARGFRVRGVLLAGHGATPEAMARTTRWDWVASVQAELDRLHHECGQVFVAGQSMGGAIALLLAARDPGITALATTSAAVRLTRFDRAKILVGSRLVRWHYPNRDHVDLWDRDAVSQLRSYNKRALSSHVELIRVGAEALRAANHIQVPALILHGLRDATVPPGNAALIANAINQAGAGPRATVRYFERSGHAMTVDVDQVEIFQLIGDHFLQAASPTQRAQRAGSTTPATAAAPH